MAVVTKVFDVLTRKLQKLQFNPVEKPLEIDENSSSSSYDYFINESHSRNNMQTVDVPPAQTMDMDLLEKKIKRLLLKLKKHNIYLHVFNHTDIHYGPTLGKGGEGIVQKCTVVYNDLPVDAAVKTVLNSTDDALDITFDEIELLCLAKDPIMDRTLKVYGVAAVPNREDTSKGHLVIITEAGIKNVLQLYQDENIPLHVTYDLWHNIAVALHCLHKKTIIHQDLKPENVLVTGVFRDNYGMLERVEIKVIDLGMARLVENGKVVSDDVVGTTGYHSPEVLFDDSYDFSADIFVLGITFCVMLLPQATLRTSTLPAFLKRVHEAKEMGLVGCSLFCSVLQPAMEKDISISTPITEMICKMLERVDRRNISLLEVAATCQQESNMARQHPSHIGQNSRPRISHQDSGIDSFEVDNKQQVNNNNKENINRPERLRARRLKSEEDEEQHSPNELKIVPKTARRKMSRPAPYARKTRVDSEDKATREATTPEYSCVTPVRSQGAEEPICRRTRSSIKRLVVKTGRDEEREGQERPRKRQNLCD